MKNQAVAQAWANGDKTAKAGNMFIDGNTVYSYGYHFPIATHLENGSILFNKRKKSPSTAKHQTYVKVSLPNGVKVVFCYYPNLQANANFAAFANDMQIITNNLKKARKPEKYVTELRELYNECKDYAKHAKSTLPKEITKFRKYLK